MSENTVNVDCNACDGTGLYRGLWEKPNEAVVCVRCGGTGMMKLVYREFTGRKTRPGVDRIRKGGGLIIDDAPKHEWFSYEEFEKRYPTISAQRRFNLTAEQWNLYDPETPSSQVIAERFNVELETLFREGASKNEIRRRMHALMQINAKFGAFDTEPRMVLENILDRAFPDE